MEKSQSSSESVFICPKCGSRKFHIESGAAYALGNAGKIYICDKCGIGSPIFPSVNINKAEKLEKELSKKDKNIKEKDSKYNKKIVPDIFSLIIAILGYIFIGLPGILISKIFINKSNKNNLLKQNEIKRKNQERIKKTTQ
jgi:predicted RNA-binding Zn-ribbon protein involved in translation (DUF1610 family)